MFCVECNKDLAFCECPDIDERLESLKHSPHLALTFCEECGKYIARCSCKERTN